MSRLNVQFEVVNYPEFITHRLVTTHQTNTSTDRLCHCVRCKPEALKKHCRYPIILCEAELYQTIQQ